MLAIVAIPVIVLVSCGKTDRSQDQIDVDEVFEKFEEQYEAEGKNDVFPEWPLGKQVSTNDLGIAEPDDIKETSITYKIVAVDQEDGEVYVEVTIRKNWASRTRILDITKFQSAEQYLKQKMPQLRQIIDNKKIITSKNNQTVEEVYREHSSGGTKTPTLEDMGVNRNDIFTTEQLQDLKMEFEWGEILGDQGAIVITLVILKKFRSEKWDYEENRPQIWPPGNEKDEIETKIIGYKKE